MWGQVVTEPGAVATGCYHSTCDLRVRERKDLLGRSWVVGSGHYRSRFCKRRLSDQICRKIFSDSGNTRGYFPTVKSFTNPQSPLASTLILPTLFFAITMFA